MSTTKRDEIGVTPYLAVKDGSKAVEFYTKVLGAKEDFRLTSPDGKLCHCQLFVGDGVLMLAEEFPGFSKTPETVGGTPVRLTVAVDDVDATAAKAEQAGATVLRAAEDQFYGYRSASIRDPFGHEWILQRKIEDLDPQEMQRRFAEMCAKMSQECQS